MSETHYKIPEHIIRTLVYSIEDYLKLLGNHEDDDPFEEMFPEFLEILKEQGFVRNSL